jgi:hypothetical protein
MKSLFLFSFLILPLVILGAGCSGDAPANQTVDYEEDIKPLIEENNAGHKVRGSCNIIASTSHCEDYIGSIWTEQQMQLNCGGVGTFSLDACPYSDNGGCMTGRDTVTENVIWSYPYGGQPITGEDLYYESQACDLLEVAEWVTPASLLE